MTAHVAESDEGRGRVILRFSAWRPSDVAILWAMRVASAFHSEVEVLFVEDRERENFAGFPFAREVSIRGGAPRAVSSRAIQAEARRNFADARKRIRALAESLGEELNVYESVVRDDPVQALVSACARRGPWNVIAIAEAFGSPALYSLDELFETVTDATGIIIAGPNAQIRSGPVVLAIEDTAHLHGMLRTGERIAAALEAEIVVLLVAGDQETLANMEAEVRLALGHRKGMTLAPTNATYGDIGAVAEALRRLSGSFAIAQYGGATVPARRSLRPLMMSLECPLLLVK
jgi:hypothetical protein